jgi:hypothetical protein
LCGGRQEANTNGLKDCHLINPLDDWTRTKLPSMTYGHSNHYITYLNSSIYVVAGCDEGNRFCNKCERFDLGTCTWNVIASTNETRDSIHGALDYRHRLIYIAGGRIDNGILAHTVEVYNIETDMWRIIPVTLPYSVDMHGMVLIPGEGTKLLIFAGLDINQ